MIKTKHSKFTESENKSLLQRIFPERGGLQYLHFEARIIDSGDLWYGTSEENEYIIVILSGICSVESTSGNWFNIGKRKSVFDGKPYALYLPAGTEFSVFAETDQLELAYAWCKTDKNNFAKLIRPEDIRAKIKTDNTTTCQTNYIIPQEFECDSLMTFESYMPASETDSDTDAAEIDSLIKKRKFLTEAEKEEVCYFKFENPKGRAIQQIHSIKNKSIEIIVAEENDVVIIPEGYNSIVSAQDHNAYYLRILAGKPDPLYSIKK